MVKRTGCAGPLLQAKTNHVMKQDKTILTGRSSMGLRESENLGCVWFDFSPTKVHLTACCHSTLSQNGTPKADFFPVGFHPCELP